MPVTTYVGRPAFALGSDKRAVEDTAAQGLTYSPAAALGAAGFRFHHVCAPDETAYDLARAAVGGLDDDLAGVGAIVYATCLPGNGNLGDTTAFAQSGDVKHLMDFPVSRLQSDFDLRRAAVIGLNQQACTSALGSLRVARGLLAAEPDLDRVLCVTADRFPAGARYEQAYNLISDGAAAYIVSRAPAAFRLVAFDHATNGALVQASDDETVGSFFTAMHGVINTALDRAGISPADIDWVVPQNTNVKAWQILSRLLGVPAERVFTATLNDVGHVISADNYVNLAELAASGAVQPGQRLLLAMAGYGMNWQCAVLEAM